MTATTHIPPETEREFQRQVIGLAKLAGFRTYHTFDSRRSGYGFPDLVCVGHGRVLFIELKSEKGRVRPEQQAWIDDLSGCPGVEVYLFRPSDWPLIERLFLGGNQP